MIIYIVLAFVVFAFVLAVYVFFKHGFVGGFSSKQLAYIRAHWVLIIDSFSHSPEHAILDADKLLSYALGCKGAVGSLGERLKRYGRLFSDLDSVWSAHKLRNRIAHELDGVSKGECKVALKNFKRALNDLGASL